KEEQHRVSEPDLKNAAYPELDQVGKLETGAAMMSLKDKTMALLVAGRNATHGYHVEAEIMGTRRTYIVCELCGM
ncbi:hypothetical protein OCL90_14385, partial [Enterococcus faecalis]|nr:hypothetical protein [Enterococcus faecalis]